MELQGKIKRIFDTQQITEKFVKREFVIETKDEYPQLIIIELVQDKIKLIDKFNLFDDVKVSINIRGREWTSPQGKVKYFNTIQAWKIELVSAAKDSDENVAQKSIENISESDINENVNDDLPF